MRRPTLIILIVALLLASISGTAGAHGHRETADILDQMEADGSRAVLVEDGATLLRSPNSLSVGTAMPTPQPGSYAYPETGVFSGPGHPEGFTLWAFIFNFPELCTPPACDADDVFDDNAPAQGGAYFVTGHLVGGNHLQLEGQVSTSDTPVVGSALVNPAGAEVHLAVAPHGGLDGSLMPEQIKTPTGPARVWWVALFT